MNSKTTLIYDEQCPLCKRFKQALERLDHQNLLVFLDANDDQTYQVFTFLIKEDCLGIAHLIKEDGEVVTGGDIITALVKEYPTVSKISWLLETDVGKKVNNFFYKSVDKLRRRSLRGCKKCSRNHVSP